MNAVFVRTMAVVSGSLFAATPAQSQIDVEGAPAIISAIDSASSTYTKTYSKADLAKTMPNNPNQTLGAQLSQEFTRLIKRMGAQQGGKSQRDRQAKITSARLNADTYFTSLDAMRSAPVARQAQAANVSEYFAQELQTATDARVRQEMDFLAKFQQGMKLNLDLGALFGGSDTAPKTAQAAPRLRYGLVLRDIEHDWSAPRQAALNSDDNPLNFAGQAEVRYTIGPITEAEGRKVFNFKSFESINETDLPSADDLSIWQRINWPSTKFKGKVTPEKIGKLSGLDGDALPNWNLQLQQADELLVLDYKLKSDGTTLEQSQKIRLPVYGTLAVTRSYNQSWQTQETSVTGLLLDQRLPSLDLSYNDLEQRYLSSGHVNVNGHRWGLEAQGAATGPADQPEEKYSLSYSRSF